MSLHSIHLRKLLKFLYLQGQPRVSAFRSDIRDDLARDRDEPAGGGDFYGPFWRDAKDHVFGIADLRVQTRLRVAANSGRANLYSRLRDGFLTWWDERRRWTNEPFRQAEALRRVCRLPGVNLEIKIANILSVRDGNGEDHFVYPYWFPEPAMTEEMGRIALWTLTIAFPNIDHAALRVLDVIRGQTYSLDRTPLQGNESAIFQRRFRDALAEWERLRCDYE